MFYNVFGCRFWRLAVYERDQKQCNILRIEIERTKKRIIKWLSKFYLTFWFQVLAHWTLTNTISEWRELEYAIWLKIVVWTSFLFKWNVFIAMKVKSRSFLHFFVAHTFQPDIYFRFIFLKILNLTKEF